MKTPPYIAGDAGAYFITCHPFGSGSHVHWTGGSLTSAELRPRIKYFETREEAEINLPLVSRVYEKMMTATY